MMCSGTLILTVGCGSSDEPQENSSEAAPQVSATTVVSKPAQKTASELEQAQELCTGLLRSLDNTRFPIYSDDYEEGIRFNFTDVSENGCTVSWDSYVVRDYGVGINPNWTINDSLYGSKYCTFEPLYNNGALSSFLLDGVMMTKIDASADGTPVVDVYNFRILFDFENETSQLHFTKSTSGADTKDYSYNGDKMQELFDTVEDEDDKWVEFASYVAKYGSIADLDKFDSHYYKVIDAPMTWTEARDACEEVGGHLAAITSEEEQSFICDIIKNSNQANMWIGGYYSEDDDEWYWVDGSDWDYTNWDDPQPDNYTGDEFYLRMKNRTKKYSNWEAVDGKWNDTADTADGFDSRADAPISTFGYVCEWDSLKDIQEHSLR